jgi:hypothetical protein
LQKNLNLMNFWEISPMSLIFLARSGWDTRPGYGGQPGSTIAADGQRHCCRPFAGGTAKVRQTQAVAVNK